MEFFEKAHIARTNKSHRKDNKSGETIKKQLKQMLYGYKNSDNKLIKDSEDLNNYLNDSSSVSGVSDLDLTNSSFEGDLPANLGNTNDTSLSEDKEVSIQEVTLSDTELKDLQRDSKHKKSQENDPSESSNESENDEISPESLSDFEEEIESLPDDVVELDLPDLKDELSIDFSTQTSDTSEEAEFDPDGLLAAKILKKLDKTKEKVKKGRKRKVEEKTKKSAKTEIEDTKQEYKGPFRPKEDNNIDLEMEAIESGLSKVKLPRKTIEKDSEVQSDNSNSISDKEFSIDTVSDISENLSQVDTVDESDDQTPFVSVLAANAPSQSFSDVLGDYCYPTVRNLPYEGQNVYSTDNSGIFQTEDANISDVIEPEDEVGSLVPEVDNETVQDLDVPTDLDTSSTAPNEESTINDETIQSEELSEMSETVESMDTVVNPVKVYNGNNCCILVMKHPAQVYIHGKVRVKSLGGTVEVAGYVLQDDTYEVYAPNNNYAQCMKTIENDNAFYGLFSKLTADGLSVSEAEEIVTSIEEYDAVVEMSPLRTRKIEFVQNNFNSADLFGKQKNVDLCLRNACNMLGCAIYLSKPWRTLHEPVSWKQVIQYGLAEQHSRGIVCGGKGAGKSTFLRFYVNKLLAQGPLLVIDLDPGQCEFTVAGNVSATVVIKPLLGPNFTHLQVPKFSLHIGMINTMDHPKRYVNAVETIISHCYNDETLTSMPWIVNTMGMTNALGLKFMSLIILTLKPTFLLQIDSKNQKNRYDFHLYPQTVKNLYFEDFQNDSLFKNLTESDLDYKFFITHHTENSVKNKFSLPPRDERYLNYLAYFGELLDVKNGNLLGIVPYEVNLKDLGVLLNVRVSEDAVCAVLNGKVVALCSGDQRSGVATLGDQPLRFYGCGLIRGIDSEKGKVYIITPTPSALLANVNTVVYSDWVPELRGPERTLPVDTQVPYRTASLYHHRQLMFAPKRRFNPIQLLKMARSS